MIVVLNFTLKLNKWLIPFRCDAIVGTNISRDERAATSWDVSEPAHKNNNMNISTQRGLYMCPHFMNKLFQETCRLRMCDQVRLNQVQAVSSSLKTGIPLTSSFSKSNQRNTKVLNQTVWMCRLICCFVGLNSDKYVKFSH